METLGFVGGLITSLGGVPQIYHIVRTKQTGDLSWSMLSAWFVGLSMTSVYAFSIRAVPICVNCIISLTNTCTIISLKLYFESSSSHRSSDHAKLQKHLGFTEIGSTQSEIVSLV